MYLFCFFFTHWTGKDLRIKFNTSGESGYPRLVSGLRRKEFRPSPLVTESAVGPTWWEWFWQQLSILADKSYLWVVLPLVLPGGERHQLFVGWVTFDCLHYKGKVERLYLLIFSLISVISFYFSRCLPWLNSNHRLRWGGGCSFNLSVTLWSLAGTQFSPLFSQAGEHRTWGSLSCFFPFQESLFSLWWLWTQLSVFMSLKDGYFPTSTNRGLHNPDWGFSLANAAKMGSHFL